VTVQFTLNFGHSDDFIGTFTDGGNNTGFNLNTNNGGA
jgi:hypothetical protein